MHLNLGSASSLYTMRHSIIMMIAGLHRSTRAEIAKQQWPNSQ